MPKTSICLTVVFGAVVAAWSSPAFAHIKLKSPMSRDPNTELKDPPCGPSTSTRGSTVTMLMAGQKLMVEWDETIQHPGHYRIAFDSDGQDFPDPKSFTDVAAAGTDLGMGVTVLVDDIKDMSGPIIGATPYKVEITLPDIECSNCTLQLIQVMTDKSPYGNGDDIYHECANLVLKKAPGGAAAGSGGMAAAGSGAGAGGAVAGAAAGAGAGAGGSAAAGSSGAAGTGMSGASGGAAGRMATATAGSAAGSGVAGSMSGTAGAGPAPTTTGMMTSAQTGAAGSTPAATAGMPAMPPGAAKVSDGCTVSHAGSPRSGTPLLFGMLAVAAGVFQRLRSRSRSSRFRGKPQA